MSSKKTKVLVIGEAFFPEEFIINDLVKEWLNEDFEIEVLTRTPSYPYGKPYNGYKNKLYQKEYFGDILIHRIPIIPGYQKSNLIKLLNYFTFVFFASLVALKIGKRFDKVFVYQTGPLTLAIPANLIKIFYKKKVIIWTQDLWPDTVYAFGFKESFFLKKFLDGLVSFVYNNTDLILVSCSGFESKIQKYLKKDIKIEWVPNWPLIEFKSARKTQLPGKINFTFAGNIGKVQNLDNVLKGFRCVAKDNDDVWLNIVGDGSNLEDLKLLVKQQEIPNVNFMGRKPLGEMPEIYNSTDFLIISLIESPLFRLMIPSKFQTYISYSKPIFAVMEGEVPNLVDKYKIGLNSKPNDLKGIDQTFRKFISLTKQEINDMGNNCDDVLNNYFSREVNVKKMVNCLNQV